MDTVRQVKLLESQLKEIDAEIAAVKIEISNRSKMLSQKQKIQSELKAKIDGLKENSQLRVSEHAIVRYFERVMGFNIEEIEKLILSPKIRGFVEVLGSSGTYPNEGFSVVMKNNVVTTIVL